MNRQSLDELTAAIRSERPEDHVVAAAAKRVFRNVFDSAFVAEPVGRIKNCSDFQNLMPAYRDGSLGSARVALLEDHVVGCPDCRRVLHQADAGEQGRDRRNIRSSASRAKKRPAILPWAVAATLAAGTAVGVTGAFQGLLPGQHAVRATVLSVEGTLYRVSDLGSSLVEAGAVIRNAEELRTAKGSRAIFRLVSGAQVEMGERSDVSVSRNWSGTAVDVERGHIIVQALGAGAKQFLVAAGDVRVPVRNAVLSVNRGIKGSRIAVAKGSATVQDSEKTFELSAGQQLGADYRLVNASMVSEFAWSKNADYYLGLLNELSTLQKQWEAIPAPQPRFSPELAKYLPDNTVLYAAIPNLGDSLSEAKRIFDARLAESQILRDWWQQQPASRNGDLDKALTQISSIAAYLGNEVVLSVSLLGPHRYSQPVFLAQVRQPGLREYLEQNVPTGTGLQILTPSAAAVPAKPGSLFVSVNDNLVIASTDPDELKSLSQAASNPAAGHFTQTPFFNRISQSYGVGAGYLFAVDMEQLVAKSVSTAKEVPPGFNNARYLVLERGEKAGDTEMRASLSFAGAREGIASWLGAPGPLGSIDFVSPDATLAVAAVMKNPLTIVQEFIGYATNANANSKNQLSDAQHQLGIKLAEDVAAPLGGDATFALDGPLLPIPSWKLALEVDDFPRLQQAISALVDYLNQLPARNGSKLLLSSEDANSRTFYSIHSDKMPNLAVYYTFVDGFVLAGNSEANLLAAIHNREGGYTLASSSGFRNQLPVDNNTNLSAVVYHNAGKSLGSAADQLKASGALSASQQQALSTLISNGAPGLVCVYGEPDRIVAASKGSFLGFNLGTLIGIEQGRPLLPLIVPGANPPAAQPAAKVAQQRF